MLCGSESLYFFLTFFFFFGYDIVVTWIYVIFVTLFNVFDEHRGKYAKPDFVKFISLKMNYLVGTGCFVFKKYRHAFLSGNKIKLPISFFIFFTFILFSPPLPGLTSYCQIISWSG